MTPLDWFNKRKKVNMSATGEVLIAYLHELGLTQVMDFNYYASKTDIASPATIHREIKWLTETGYVKTVHLEGNLRSKYLVVTEKAKKYLGVLK